MISQVLTPHSLASSAPRLLPVAQILAVALLTLACYLNAYYLPPVLPYLVFALGLAFIVVDDILGLKFYLLSLLVFDDFPKYFAGVMGGQFNTIFNIQVAGNTMFMIWTSLMFGKLLLRESMSRQFSVNALRFPREMKGILLVFMVAALWGFPNVLTSAKYYVNDFSFLVNTLVGLYAAYTLVRSEEDLKRYFMLFLVICFIRYSIVLIDGVGMSMRSVMYTLKAESGAYLSIIPLTYFVIYSYRKKQSGQFNRKVYLFLMSCSALTIAYNVVTASRGRFIVLALAFCFAMVVTGKYRIMLFALLAVLAVVGAIYTLNPNFVHYAGWKMATVRPGTEESASSTVRAIEYHNIIGQQMDQLHQLPLGTGYGGFFTSRYRPFNMELGIDAYPDEWIARDEYYKPHSTVLFSLLKFGLIGSLVFYLSLVSISLKSLKAALRINDSSSDILIALSLALPLLFIVNFTPKTQVLSGVILGVLVTGRALQVRNENSYNSNRL